MVNKFRDLFKADGINIITANDAMRYAAEQIRIAAGIVETESSTFECQLVANLNDIADAIEKSI